MIANRYVVAYLHLDGAGGDVDGEYGEHDEGDLPGGVQAQREAQQQREGGLQLASDGLAGCLGGVGRVGGVEEKGEGEVKRKRWGGRG